MNKLNSTSSTNFNEIEMEKLKVTIQGELNSISILPIEAKKEKNEDIKSMITYYDGMTKTIEDRRTHSAEFAWQSIAVTITAFGIIFALPIISFIKLLILLVLGEITIISFIKIREYNAQSAYRYPFLKFNEYGNKWKWFYYGNEYIPKINSSPFIGEKEKNEDRLNYLNGLKLFINKYSQETLDKEINDNILQLYLLQVHNFYKNRFYLRLQDYDQKTPEALLITIIIYLIIFLLFMLASSSMRDFLLTKTF